MAGIIFARVKIKYILDPITKKKDRNYSVNDFIGPNGGNDVEHISTNGTQLSFNSVVGKDNLRLLNSYRNLAKKYTNKVGVLNGSSDLAVKGNYYLTEYAEEKRVDGSYLITWGFQEYVKPNIVKTTFKHIGRSATKSNTQKTSKVKKVVPKKTSTFIIILLGSCGTMKYGMVNKKCVKYLQRFLQKKGYYKGYKIDGDYLQYTRAAVNQLQKAYKIKVSKSNQGQWDKTTRDYWRKKYNITTKKR